MKIKNLLLLLFLSTAIISCSDDDSINSGGDTSGELVGNWKMVSFNYDGATVTSGQGANITADFVGVGSDFNYTIEFTEAPNNFTSTGTYDLELTTTVSGQTTVDTQNDLNGSGSGTWSKNGNTLTTTINSETEDSTIEILSDTTLKITSTVTRDISQQGFSVITTTNNVSVFERL